MVKQASKRNPHVTLPGHKFGLPYSKGIMASSIMATGLAPARAYSVAERVEELLLERSLDEISSEAVRDLAAKVLAEQAGKRYSQAYLKWEGLSKVDVPLIILIGGATGVGKSTIASQLAARLGITRVISTDAIREVLRTAFSKELMPFLHSSSYNVDALVRGPLPENSDSVVIGFLEQVHAVAVGVEGLIARAIEESTDMIIEGAHVVPGFLKAEAGHRAAIVSVEVTVEDENLHRSHFHMRTRETARHQDRYLDSFDNIRKIQKYVKSLALKEGVPIIPSYNLDSTVVQIVDLVMNRIFEVVRQRDEARAVASGAIKIRDGQDPAKPRSQAGVRRDGSPPKDGSQIQSPQEKVAQ